MATKHWPFNNPADYMVSDPGKIEVANGVARLKTGYPADLLFYARYNTTLDADYSKQGITVPDYITGDVSIDSSLKKVGAGSLKLVGASSSPYIYYAAQEGFGQTGTISFWRYVNATLTDADCMSIWTNDVNTDILYLVGDPSITQLLFFMYDANGVDVFYLYANDVPNDAWHHVEINFDFAVGVARLFVNGILKDTATFAPTTMTPGLVDITIGNRTQSAGNAYFDEVRIYSSVQHIANFTPDTQELGGQGYPADLSLYGKFDTDLNLAHNATGSNQPSMQAGSIGISSGKIGAGSFCGWPSTTNPDLRYNGTTDVTGIGSICYWYLQSVDGQWQGDTFRIHLSPVSGSANRLSIYHDNSASVYARLYDNNTSEIFFIGTNFTKSSAWRYVEVNWNCNLGQYRIFLDGVLKQIVTGAPRVRNAAAYLRIEAEGGSIPQVFYVDDLRVYNTVLHTSNYVPPDTELIENLYTAGKPYIQPTTAFNPNHVKHWNGFSELLSPNNAGSVKYVLSDDNGVTWKYWNGSGWTVGGNENNNNTANEINSHLAAFTLTPDTFLFRGYLISNGSQQVELDNVALDYSHVNYRININPDADFSAGMIKKLNISANAIDAAEQVNFISWFKVQGGVGFNLRVLINPTAELISDIPYKPRISADSFIGDSLSDWANWWFRTAKSFFNLHVLIDPQADFGETELINILAGGQTPGGTALADFSWWFETGLLPPSPYTELTGEWVNLGENSTIPKGQLQRFLKMISFALDEVKGMIDAFPVMLNVDKTDADYLPLIAALVGIDFSYDIPIPRQREEIKRAVEIYKTKGSIPGIKRFCRNIIGFDPQIAEWPPRILMSNNPAQVSARITTPGVMDNLGLMGDQAFYSLDFSETGDYRFDKFGIYFFLAEYAGIPKSAIAKVLRLLSKHIPASTVGRIIFVDHTYSLAADGQPLTSDIYHAFGTGEDAWDNQLPQPLPNQTRLINEIYRRKPDGLVYLDANGFVTTAPTNKIRAVTILKDNESGINSHNIREQGLFANATTQKDSGTLLGAINHKGQWKTDGFRIRKTIEVTLQH